MVFFFSNVNSSKVSSFFFGSFVIVVVVFFFFVTCFALFPPVFLCRSFFSMRNPQEKCNGSFLT